MSVWDSEAAMDFLGPVVRGWQRMPTSWRRGIVDSPIAPFGYILDGAIRKGSSVDNEGYTLRPREAKMEIPVHKLQATQGGVKGK